MISDKALSTLIQQGPIISEKRNSNNHLETFVSHKIQSMWYIIVILVVFPKIII